MRPIVHEISTAHTPESLVEQVRINLGQLKAPAAVGSDVVLLRSLPSPGPSVEGEPFDSPQARYSFVTARPFLIFRSFGSRCELRSGERTQIQFGNPWHVLDSLMARCELLEEIDLPFPLGG